MKLASILAAAAGLAAVICVTPVLADQGHGRHNDESRRDYRGGENAQYWRNYRGPHDENRHHDDRRTYRGEHERHHAKSCPPGLAKKNDRCLPPGQAKKHDRDDRYGRNIGDRLPTREFSQIRDPRRFNLEQRNGWRYYREGDRIYRVDDRNNRVLSVFRVRN